MLFELTVTSPVPPQLVDERERLVVAQACELDGVGWCVNED